jgi:hypothetical protein
VAADMDHLHVKRIELVDFSYIVIENLVVDALSALLEAASRNGRISGLVPHLVDGGLTHLQYANDIMMMIQMEEESMVNLKLVLYCLRV